MSQHYPNQPQQPDWGPQPPTWGPPPPPRRSTGKIVALTIGGVLALLLVIGIIGAAADNGSGSDDKPTTVTASSPAADKPAKQKDTAAEPEPEPDAPVKVTAKETAFAKSILADSNGYTSVKVTVTNNSDDEISVNPLYFAITDTDGGKHTSELGMDENQIGTVKLAPGENVTGVVTGKGKFDAKYVTFTDGLFGEALRANVS